MVTTPPAATGGPLRCRHLPLPSPPAPLAGARLKLRHHGGHLHKHPRGPGRFCPVWMASRASEIVAVLELLGAQGRRCRAPCFLFVFSKADATGPRRPSRRQRRRSMRLCGDSGGRDRGGLGGGRRQRRAAEEAPGLLQSRCVHRRRRPGPGQQQRRRRRRQRRQAAAAADSGRRQGPGASPPGGRLGCRGLGRGREAGAARARQGAVWAAAAGRRPPGSARHGRPLPPGMDSAQPWEAKKGLELSPDPQGVLGVTPRWREGVRRGRPPPGVQAQHGKGGASSVQRNTGNMACHGGPPGLSGAGARAGGPGSGAAPAGRAAPEPHGPRAAPPPAHLAGREREGGAWRAAERGGDRAKATPPGGGGGPAGRGRGGARAAAAAAAVEPGKGWGSEGEPRPLAPRALPSRRLGEGGEARGGGIAAAHRARGGGWDGSRGGRGGGGKGGGRGGGGCYPEDGCPSC